MKQSKIIHVATALACISICAFLYAPYITISQPGDYTLGDNINYTPSGSGDSIIMITTNNVIFDLRGHTLSQADINTNVHGIFINPNLSNITIKNGSVQDVTGTGIAISQGCSRILVENITTFSTLGRGISLNGLSTASVVNSAILNTNIVGCARGATGDFALSMTFAERIRVENCQLTNNGHPGITHATVRLDNVTQSQFKNVHLSKNNGSTSVKGFEFNALTDSIFMMATLRQNEVNTNGTTIGFDFSSSCTNIIMVNCTVLSLTAAGASSSIVGYRLQIGNDDNIFEACKVSECIGAGTVSGISSDFCSRNIFMDTTVSRNASTGGTASGCLVTSNTSVKFVRCIFADQSSTAGDAHGMRISFCADSLFQENVCARNNGSSAATSYGIRMNATAPVGNNIFTKNLALRNGTTSANQFTGLLATQFTLRTSDSMNAITAWTNTGIV